MTLCAQYIDSMKKRTLAQNGMKLNIEEEMALKAIYNSPAIKDIKIASAKSAEFEQKDITDFIIKYIENNTKPKRPRGKKVYSTDKGKK